MKLEYYKSDVRLHILPAITHIKFFSERTLKFSFLRWELDITWNAKV